MDAFVTRKKRKSSPTENEKEHPQDVADDESTEVRLAILSSLHPDFPQEALLDVLLAHDGSVVEASASLFAPSPDICLTPSKKSASTVGSQTSLRTFATPSTLPKDGAPALKKSKLLSRKGATLHLYDAHDIAEHTPCSIIHNFLPSALANDLLKEMLEESQSFEKITFKLFDNVVSSPHTSSFYVESYDEMEKQKIEVGSSTNSQQVIVLAKSAAIVVSVQWRCPRRY